MQPGAHQMLMLPQSIGETSKVDSCTSAHPDRLMCPSKNQSSKYTLLLQLAPNLSSWSPTLGNMSAPEKVLLPTSQ